MKNTLIICAVGIVGTTVGFGAGRYLVPSTSTTLQVETYSTVQWRTAWTYQSRSKKQEKLRLHVRMVQVKKPDGTEITTSTMDTVHDSASETSTIASGSTIGTETVRTSDKKEIVAYKPSWAVESSWRVIPNPTWTPVQVGVQRRVVGGVWAGAACRREEAKWSLLGTLRVEF